MDIKKAVEFSHEKWQEKDGIVQYLKDYISIPNASPFFDSEYYTNGLTEKAMKLMLDWVKKQDIPGLTVEMVEEEGRTPLLVLELPARGPSTKNVLLYGHMDKQPPLEGLWEDGLEAYTPVLRDGKLYGRGGADDGYAMFASLTAMMTLQRQGLDHPHLLMFVESGEESGSPDLPYYVDKFKERLGEVDLVVCLDSGCLNYEQLFLTMSLRGAAAANVRVDVLTEGMHSGMASGVVPSSFRVFREMLTNVEDAETGRVILDDLHVDIPQDRLDQAEIASKYVGTALYDDIAFIPGGKPVTDDVCELLLNRTWRPQLEVTGADGFPPTAIAGNVLRPFSEFKLSMRLPPTLDPAVAHKAIGGAFANPLHGMKSTYKPLTSNPGWSAPSIAPWLASTLDEASEGVFGKKTIYMGEGGSIPFMGMLGKKFPKAQFVITGVLGPKSNAHGPNEFIHIGYAEKITACIAYVLSKAN